MTLSLNTARAISKKSLAARAVADDRANNLICAELVCAFNVLADADAASDKDLAERLWNTRRGAFAYDEAGNYVGSVANENGWTA